MYTPQLAEEVCKRLSLGESLRKICEDDHMPPPPTVRLWALDDREGFAARYAQARDLGLDAMADEVLGVADGPAEGNGDAIRDRLRFDARRWYLSKLAPKRYGDRIAQEISGPDGGPVEIDDKDAAARIAKLMALAQQRHDDTEGLV